MSHLQQFRVKSINRMKCTNTINVFVLGKQGTGKTSLFKQLHGYIESKYPEDTFNSPNRFAFQNEKATFLISDVAMPTMSQSRLVANVNTGDAFILVYALDDKESFDYAESMREYIISRKGESAPIIIVGNKSDLSKDRAIPFPIVDCLVTVEWDSKYIELSALNKDRVPLVLDLLLPSMNLAPFHPDDQDLDVFELRGMKFMRDSKTKSQPRAAVRTFQRFLSFGGNGTPKQDGTKQFLSKWRRISLPTFLTWRRSSRV